MRNHLPLSAKRIKKTQPAQHDLWLSDASGSRNTGSLLLRITPSGTRRFYFRYSVAGGRKTVPLGVYSHIKKPGRITLSEARTISSQLASALFPPPGYQAVERAFTGLQRASGPAATGSNSDEPSNAQLVQKEIEKSAQAIQVEPPALTLLELCQAYQRWQEELKKPSAPQTRYVINNYIAKSALASLPASAIESSQFSELLRAVIDQNKGRTAAKVRSLLHAAYARALGAALDPSASAMLIDPSLKSNPISVIPSLSQYRKPRQRKLSRAELRHVWSLMQFNKANVNDIAFRALRLSFLLAGQRCEQLVRVPALDVDLDLKVIRLEDWKGNRVEPRIHVVPLSPMALQEVEWLLAHSRSLGSSYLFPSVVEGKRVNAGTVSRLVTDMCQEMLTCKKAAAHFQFSDLRRTVETTLSSYGVTKDHRAQLLSHGISGVQDRHYDMYDYLKEKREALAIWEQHLALLSREIGQEPVA